MLKVANSVINASQITGVLPVVNGGTGVTTSTGTGNTVLSASPTLSGDVNLSTGNLVIGTAGKGIDFSVTSSGSGTMTSELLADYEEGTWTPTLVCGTSGTITLNSAFAGTYTKVGRQVTICVSWYADSVASPVGSLTMNGLPFTCNPGNSFGSACAVHGQNTLFPAGSFIDARVLANTTSIVIYAFTSGQITDAASYVQSTTYFTFTCSYFV